MPNKDCVHEPATKKKFSKHQENNAVVQLVVDEIIFQEKNKLSSEDEAKENIDSEIDEDDLYEIDNISLFGRK